MKHKILGSIRATCAAMAGLTLLAACTLPRGAALQSEITGEAHNDLPSYQVIDVTRETLNVVGHWPTTGWNGKYNWLNGTRGPKSALIQPGDKLDLVVWDSQENSLLTSESQKVVNMQGLVVSTSGLVFVPYVEEVKVGGHTPEAARMMIQRQLTAILPAAQVQLSVTPGVGNSVDLVSGVSTPGTYPLPNRDYRILSLISQGGGISSSLRNPLVRLMRNGQSFEIPSKELFGNPSRNIVLRGGDQVIVEEDDRFFTALGATGSEELIYFDREYITALEAMSMAGGINDNRANPQGVLVLREYPASAVRSGTSGPNMKYVIFVIDLTSADGLFAARKFPIHPNDTVLVTESPLGAANDLFNLVGRLFFVGGQLSN